MRTIHRPLPVATRGMCSPNNTKPSCIDGLFVLHTFLIILTTNWLGLLVYGV